MKGSSWERKSHKCLTLWVSYIASGKTNFNTIRQVFLEKCIFSLKKHVLIIRLVAFCLCNIKKTRIGYWQNKNPSYIISSNQLGILCFGCVIFGNTFRRSVPFEMEYLIHVEQRICKAIWIYLFINWAIL